MRGRAFVKRKNAIHNWLKAASGNELHDRLQFRLRAHVRAEQRKLAAEEKSQVNLCVIAGGCAASH